MAESRQPCQVVLAVLILVGALVTLAITIFQFFPKGCTIQEDSSDLSLDDLTLWGFSTYDLCGALRLRLVHLWNGAVFFVTGAVGLCASDSRRQPGARTGFIVLSTMVAVISGPADALICIFEAKMASTGSPFVKLCWVQAAVGMCISVVCMVAAFANCCCTSTRETENTVHLAPVVPIQTGDTTQLIFHDQLHNLSQI